MSAQKKKKYIYKYIPKKKKTKINYTISAERFPRPVREIVSFIYGKNVTSLTLCSLSMRRTFWQGVTSRAECAELSASSSFERSSFSFMDFANTSTVLIFFVCVYVIPHVYTYKRSIYAYTCTYKYFRVLPTQWPRCKSKSGGIVPHRAHSDCTYSLRKLRNERARRVVDRKRFDGVAFTHIAPLFGPSTIR